jgi:hypothetical protein
MEDMSAQEIIALAKAVSSKDYKEAVKELSVGTHHVNFSVDIVGKIRRGADYESHIVAKAEPWKLLAAALSHLNGVTIESLVRESLNEDPKLVQDVKKQATEAIKKIKAPTKTACNGKINHHIDVELSEDVYV